MQANLSNVTTLLSELENNLYDQNLDCFAENLNLLQLSLQQFFARPKLISPSLFSTLSDIESRVSKLSSGLDSVQVKTREELVCLVNNKKKIGFYNQSK